MQDLLLVKRFKLSKRKFTDRSAKYYPTGITHNEKLKIGQEVIIVGEPMGVENTVIEVSTGEIDCEPITVFFKDLSPNK